MFGRNLRYLRRKAELSHDTLADQLGFKSFTTIQKWEDGTSEPSLKICAKIAALFNVTIDQLYYDDLSITSPETQVSSIQKSLADVIRPYSESWLEIIEDPARRNLVRIALLIPANQIENAIKFLTELPTP